jgi:predicted nucleic acid-binding protein
MPALVLDSSATMAWLMPDEDEPAALEIGRIIQNAGALVPQLWHLEFANALRTAVFRKKRINIEDLHNILKTAARLPIECDDHMAHYAWTNTLNLALKYNLTPYDAAYLELAVRSALPLATFDKDLATAARALGLLHPSIASVAL